MKKITLSFCFLLMLCMANAQVDNDLKLTALPYYNYGKGVGLTSPDSLFQFNIRFRMQNRFTYINDEEEEPAYEALIRRLRLRFDGFVGDPKIVYVIQLSFAPDDVGELQDGENLNVIRDAIVFYRPNRHWNIGFGQTKLPGNRQRVNSSGALQLTDRSINNTNFNIDRDFGLQVYYLNEYDDKPSYNIKTAISTGEGRNWTQEPGNGLAFTGKLEIFPFGAFQNDGTMYEGDVKREKKPKLMFSGAYHYNNKARRTLGTLGEKLFDTRDLQSLLLDGMFKYNGWALQTAYMNRLAKNPITINPLDASQQAFVFTGEGYDAQLSRLFKNNYEIIGRFSTQQPHDDIKMLAPQAKQYTIGTTKYIWEHALKIQAEITNTHNSFFDNTKTQNWYFRFQVELGI